MANPNKQCLGIMGRQSIGSKPVDSGLNVILTKLQNKEITQDEAEKMIIAWQTGEIPTPTTGSFNTALKEAEADLFKPAASNETMDRFLHYYKDSRIPIDPKDIKILKIPVTLNLNVAAVPFKAAVDDDKKDMAPVIQYSIEYPQLQDEIDNISSTVETALKDVIPEGFTLSVTENLRVKIPTRYNNFGPLKK